MKNLSKYAFIIKHSSYSPKKQKTFLKSGKSRSEIIGVSSNQEAIKQIQMLYKKEVQLIELCGGFSKEDKNEIRKNIPADLPIGLAILDKKNINLLNKKLNIKNEIK